MCGVAGIIMKDGQSVSPDLLRNMVDLIAHRGPDGEGFFYERNIGLGHRRLAIIDLTDGGKQPMESCDGRFVITFNGEIYNYLELRDELVLTGCSFQSNSDTEVILEAYKIWGENCVKRFNGMWAFVIYDRFLQRFFCSRDRFGVKPFYYIDTSLVFAFGSEIKQLLSLLDQRRANQEILIDFLLTGVCDHTNKTFFEDVYILPSGHNLTYEVSSFSYKISRYYEIQQDSKLSKLSSQELEQRFFSLFQEGTALRLRSDVKVGTCLSGGLDSSSIATLAAEMHREKSQEPFGAITAVSEQKNNDESAFARQVAENAQMAWLTVRPSYQDFVDSLQGVTYAQEEPYGGPSIIMQYLVMKTARANGIKVLLDGQGGDEILLGYERYFAAHFASCFRQHGLWFAISELIKSGKNNDKMRPLNLIKYFVGTFSSSLRFGYYCWRHRYLKECPKIPNHLREYSNAAFDIFHLQLLENLSTNLPHLLRYEDKNSMAHSVEARLPFLDYKTLEFALSIPGEYKIREGWSKWILRQVMVGKMPNSVVWRKNKFGFEAPEEEWLQKHADQMLCVITKSALIEHYCSIKQIKRMFNKMNLQTKWRLYSVALWEQEFKVEH